MTNFNPVQLFTRAFKAAALLAFATWSSSVILAAPAATVVAVEPTSITDLVLLRGGFDAGLRQGMVCRVMRDSTEIAEVLLVELRRNHGAALILTVAPKQSIRVGDVASVKILKT